jgi:hypothetical protein
MSATTSWPAISRARWRKSASSWSVVRIRIFIAVFPTSPEIVLAEDIKTNEGWRRNF